MSNNNNNIFLKLDCLCAHTLYAQSRNAINIYVFLKQIINSSILVRCRQNWPTGTCIFFSFLG